MKPVHPHGFARESNLGYVRVFTSFGLPLTFLYFFGRKNFPWRFMWCLVVDFLLYFIVPSALLARLANIFISSACVITISLLVRIPTSTELALKTNSVFQGADPAFAAASIMGIGYIDIYWRTIPLHGMFMAAHSTVAGFLVLLAIAMMLSEEGAHKYMVRYHCILHPCGYLSHSALGGRISVLPTVGQFRSLVDCDVPRLAGTLVGTLGVASLPGCCPFRPSHRPAWLDVRAVQNSVFSCWGDADRCGCHLLHHSDVGVSISQFSSHRIDATLDASHSRACPTG